MANKEPGIRKALTIQFVSKYANVAVQILLSAILSRLLTPEQYGLLAIVTVFISFFQIVADLGIGPAIIQFRDLEEDDFSGLFTFSALLGLLLMGLFCLLALPISYFYEEERLVGLCCFSSICVLFSSLNMVPNGVLLRRKRFASIGVRLVFSTVVAGTFAVILALEGFGVYALAANSVLSSLIVFAWNFLVAKIKLGNRHFIAPLRKVVSYSAFQAGFGIVNYLSRNLDNLLIGKILGTETLGLYNKAYNLTTYPNTYLAGVIGSVLQPYLAEHQDDPDYLFKYWKKLTKLLSLVAAVVATVFICCAPEIIGILYGSSWDDSVPLLCVLSVSVYFQIVNNPNGAMFQSANRTNYQFRHAVIAFSMTLVGLVVGLLIGDVASVALGVALAYCGHTISIVYYLVHKTFRKPVVPYLLGFVPEIIVMVIAIAAVFALGFALSANIVISLFQKLAILAACFLVGYAATGQLVHLKVLIKR